MERRAANLLVALLLCGATLVPTATASIVGPRSHACCVRHQASHHCAGMQEAVVPEIGATGKMECAHCCPSLASPASTQAKPAAAAVSPAPVASHPFLDEFYPSESSDGPLTQDSQRAPPEVSSR